MIHILVSRYVEYIYRSVLLHSYIVYSGIMFALYPSIYNIRVFFLVIKEPIHHRWIPQEIISVTRTLLKILI